MTIFEVRDFRFEEYKFRPVPRALYKKMITTHSRSGQPLTTGTEYRDGVPVKQLTLKEHKNG